MRASDMPPEEQAAHYARVRQALARADEGLRASREREVPTELWRPLEPRQAPAAVAEEQRQAATQQPRPTNRGTTMSPETAANWNRWCDERIETRLTKFGEHYTEAVLEHLQERFTRGRGMTNDAIKVVADRVERDGEATVQLVTEQEKRIAVLEARLAELEARAVLKSAGPKLVVGD